MTKIVIQDHKTYEIYQTQEKYGSPLPRIGETISLVLSQPRIVGVKRATEFVKIINIIHDLGVAQETYISILVERK